MPSSNRIALGSAILTPFLSVLYTFWQNKSRFVLKNLFSASQPFSSAYCLPQEKKLSWREVWQAAAAITSQGDMI